MTTENIARHIEIIPAVKMLRSDMQSSNRVKLRVAAYARVSTDSDDQMNSFDAQCDYYTRIVRYKNANQKKIYGYDGRL